MWQWSFSLSLSGCVVLNIEVCNCYTATHLDSPFHIGNDRVCLIGLHCCGDLTPVILRWFSHTVTSPCLRALVLVGCCYHKMTSSKDMCGQFQSLLHRLPPPSLPAHLTCCIQCELLSARVMILIKLLHK